jgi:hypothetical protein
MRKWNPLYFESLKLSTKRFQLIKRALCNPFHKNKVAEGLPLGVEMLIFINSFHLTMEALLSSHSVGKCYVKVIKTIL